MVSDPAIDRYRWGPCIAIAIDRHRQSDGDDIDFPSIAAEP
jgi:hypothetical protein